MEHGHGKCISADGATYDGQWTHGNRYPLVHRSTAVHSSTALLNVPCKSMMQTLAFAIIDLPIMTTSQHTRVQHMMMKSTVPK